MGVMPETGRDKMAETGACRRMLGRVVRRALSGAGGRTSPGKAMTLMASLVLPAGVFSPGSPALSVLSLPAHAEVFRGGGVRSGRGPDLLFLFSEGALAVVSIEG